MKEKYRPPVMHGTENWNAKFTVQQILEIRASTLSQNQLAKKWGVNQSNISRIRNGKAWRSVT